MAFGIGNTIGTGTRTGNGTSTTITTSAATVAGDVIFVFVAKDNEGTTDAENNEVTSVADSGGTNVYQKAGEYTNGQGASGSGVTVALFYCKTTADLASSSTITVNHDSQTDVALSAWKITTSGTGFSFSPVGSATPAVVDGTAHGASVSISSLESGVEHVFVRATAIEDEVLSLLSDSANYQRVSNLPSTTAGGNAANVYIIGELDINTATSSTSAPTYNTSASTQSATVFWAFKEQANMTPAPGAGSASITGQTPTISVVSGPIEIAVANAVASLAGQEPSLALSFGLDVGIVSVSGLQPVISTDTILPVDVGVVQLTALTPSILVDTIFQPGQASLTLSGLEPTVSVPTSFKAAFAVANAFVHTGF